MIVLVTGGRNYEDRNAVFQALHRFHTDQTVSVLVHGACCWQRDKTELRGADRWGQEWAQENEVPYLGIPARWTVFGKSAGGERNGRMLLATPRPQYVIAFPGGNGTADMVRQAKRANITVWQPFG